MKSKRAIFLLVALVLVGTVSSHTQSVFSKSSANPILPAWGNDPVDPNGYQVTHSPTVFYDSTLSMYRMWFISQSTHSSSTVVSTAISFDGSFWYTAAKNPVLRTGAFGSFDEQILAPRVIRDSNTYRLYYTGVSSSTRKIGLAHSTDGIHWSKDPNNPVLSPGAPGSWDSQMIGWCSVLKTDTAYFMWYNGTTSNTWQGIGLATSSDGILWNKYADNPVFVKASTGWDSYEVATPSVIQKDGLFYMFYEGQSAPGPYAFGWAYSQDGIHWTRSTPNPVLEHGTGWEELLGTGEVTFRNNKLSLWYSGLSTVTNKWQIGLATADFPFTTGGIVSPFQPEQFSISLAYPNPFNPSTSVRYQIPVSSHVIVSVHDVLGRQVSILVDDTKSAGTYVVTFDASHLSSGTYFCRIQSGSYVATQKMVLLK